MKPDTATLQFDRRLALPPDRLWQVLTDPAHRENWAGPTEDTVLVTECADLREGGQDRHRCGPAEAPDFVVDTRWYRLDEPALAAFTETLVIGGETLCTSLVTYRLAPDGTGTALGVSVAVSSFAGAEVLDEVGAGWEGGLANLERHIGTLLAEAGR